MHPPDELMTEAFLPAMRQITARELRQRGLSQNRISSLLGVTQASVSIYLGSEDERAYRNLAALGLQRGDAKRSSAALADAVQAGPVDGIRVLGRIWTGLLGKGSVCPAHREMYPSLAECEYCIDEFGKEEEATNAVTEVAAAVKLLERSPEFIAVMPEVSVNIACAVGDPTSPSDVVAVPGRIVKVRARARAMLPPEKGASVHMSRVLILARRWRRDLRAVINLRYDEKMRGVARRAGLRPLVVPRHPNRGADDPTVEALERALRTDPGYFDSIIDEGGSGLEPNIYLFAKGAGDAARMAVRLAESYSAA